MFITKIARCILLLIAVAANGFPQSPTSFDVVSIKPSDSTDGRFSYRSFPGGRLSCFGMTLKALINGRVWC